MEAHVKPVSRGNHRPLDPERTSRCPCVVLTAGAARQSLPPTTRTKGCELTYYTVWRLGHDAQRAIPPGAVVIAEVTADQ
jgi:hypothetical protein